MKKKSDIFWLPVMIKNEAYYSDHDTTRKLFRHLPHQRNLPEYVKENIRQMLEMKGNQNHKSSIMQQTGNVMLMKDIHNLK